MDFSPLAPCNIHIIPGVCLTAFFFLSMQYLFNKNKLKYPPLSLPITKEIMVIVENVQILKEEHEDAVLFHC